MALDYEGICCSEYEFTSQTKSGFISQNNKPNG